MNDQSFVDMIERDFSKAPLSDKEMQILTYSIKLTKHIHAMGEEDIQQLRAVGCSDREILDVCQISSYFNFVNRMAEGLGVQLEDTYK